MKAPLTDEVRKILATTPGKLSAALDDPKREVAPGKYLVRVKPIKEGRR